MLLWAATVASNLFERRITRFSEITPRARVLLGKLIKATLVTLAVVLSLTSMGVDLTTFSLFTGALGVGVGLGLQRTVSNLRSPTQSGICTYAPNCGPHLGDQAGPVLHSRLRVMPKPPRPYLG